MYEHFADLCEKYSVTPYRIAKDCGFSNVTLSDWKKGKSTPNADKLLKIARYLNTTVEYLMTGEEPQSAGEAFYSRDEQELIGDYRSLNDIGKASVKAYMTGIMQNPDMCRQKREESLQG